MFGARRQSGATALWICAGFRESGQRAIQNGVAASLGYRSKRAAGLTTLLIFCDNGRD